MKPIQRLFNLLPVFLMGCIFTVFTGGNVLAGTAVAVGLSKVNNISGVAMAGLNKEIWLAELMENFYADDMFLSELRDLSAFVDNDVINLAEAGVSPDVLLNNNVYPIAVADRGDTPLALEIDRFDTTNTRIQKADLVELSYDKLSSVVYNHRKELQMAIMERCAHAIAPTADSTFTPLIVATGADNGNGTKRLKYSDLRKLQTRFNQMEIAAEGRCIVFSQQHWEDLELEDVERFNKMTEKMSICGFKIYSLADKRLPRYNRDTGAKVAYGAAALPLTDVHATIAFQKDEVARAMGSEEFYHEKAQDAPLTRADIVGFSKRAFVGPIRNKGIAAIYSPAA